MECVRFDGEIIFVPEDPDENSPAFPVPGLVKSELVPKGK
jgi:hypothetical protein